MIKSSYEACRILGISTQTSREQRKKIYHEICRKYHPDALQDFPMPQKEQAIQYFYLAKEAYEYLELQEEQKISIPNISPAFTAKKARRPKVYGNPVRSASDSEQYQKRRQEEKKREADRRQKQMEELQKRAKELREEERKAKEQEILNQIRWLRVAQIIQQTMEEDKKKGRTGE